MVPLVVAEVRWMRPRRVIAIRRRSRQGRLERQQRQQKNAQPTSHAIESISALLTLRFARCLPAGSGRYDEPIHRARLTACPSSITAMA